MKTGNTQLLYSLLLFLFCSNNLVAQLSTVDSLRNIINSNQTQQIKLRAYILLSGKLSGVSFNENIKVAEQGLVIASKLNDSLAYAELNRNIGIANYFKGDYEKAANLYYLAAGIYERKNVKKQLAYVLNDIAKLYRKTRDLSRAGAIYERSLQLFLSLKDSSGMQMILNESGVVYEYQGNYKEALRRYRASLEIATRLKDEMGKSWSYNFIAGVYLLQNNYELAENYNLRSLAIRQKEKDTFSITLSYSDLGVLYSTWGKYERAQYYFDQSNILADKMQYKELLSNNYAAMSKMANMMGNYKSAFDFYTLHTLLKDSIFNAQKTRQIEEISTIYETSKKEQQIVEQRIAIRKQNLLLYFSAALLLISLLSAYFLYTRNKLKQKLKLNTEILLQQELATKSILEAEEKERSRIAKDLHDGVGQMMSAARMNLSVFSNNIQLQNVDQQHSLKNIITLVDDSCKEVRAVSHSMMPQVLVSKGLPQAVEELISKISISLLQINFHYEGFEQRPESNTETILYRVLQECINNTLKHAEAKYLDISLVKDNVAISITMEDDGKGFDASASVQKDGMGLKNIITRIQFLKGTVDFDAAPGKGTSIVMHVPIN